MTLHVHAEAKGLTTVQGRVAEMARRASDTKAFLSAVGHRTAFTLIPLSIRRNEMSAPSPRYRRGQPLVDTRRLVNSIAYRASKRDLVVGSAVPYAAILNRGGTILPKHGKYLLIPLSPPLSSTEARDFPQDRGAIRARYPGSFFMRGPQGPGIYRKSRVRVSTSISTRKAGYARGSRGVELIAIAVPRVVMKGRRWLTWRSAWVDDFSKQFSRWVLTGQGMTLAPASGGSWDVGKK